MQTGLLACFSPPLAASFHSTFSFSFSISSIFPPSYFFPLNPRNLFSLLGSLFFCAPVCITANFRVDNLEYRFGVSLPVSCLQLSAWLSVYLRREFVSRSIGSNPACCISCSICSCVYRFAIGNVVEMQKASVMNAVPTHPFPAG